MHINMHKSDEDGFFAEWEDDDRWANASLIPLKSAPTVTSSSSLSILELSGTQVYEPHIRALLGTTSQFCEVVILKSRTVPNGTMLS